MIIWSDIGVDYSLVPSHISSSSSPAALHVQVNQLGCRIPPPFFCDYFSYSANYRNINVKLVGHSWAIILHFSCKKKESDALCFSLVLV